MARPPGMTRAQASRFAPRPNSLCVGTVRMAGDEAPVVHRRTGSGTRARLVCRATPLRTPTANGSLTTVTKRGATPLARVRAMPLWTHRNRRPRGNSGERQANSRDMLENQTRRAETRRRQCAMALCGRPCAVRADLVSYRARPSPERRAPRCSLPSRRTPAPLHRTHRTIVWWETRVTRVAPRCIGHEKQSAM